MNRGSKGRVMLVSTALLCGAVQAINTAEYKGQITLAVSER